MHMPTERMHPVRQRFDHREVDSGMGSRIEREPDAAHAAGMQALEFIVVHVRPYHGNATGMS